MPRIPLPSPAEMSPEQRRVHDQVVTGPRGRMIGPLRAAIHSPDLAERWSALGEHLRYGTSLSPRVKELAIIITARRWNSLVEWWIHARAAREAGVPDAVVEAIRAGQAPVFEDAGEADIYEFVRQLQQHGRPELGCYQAVLERLGAQGVVELTALVGYYTMVAMTLNAHEIPLPDDVAPEFEDFGLTVLPPSAC